MFNNLHEFIPNSGPCAMCGLPQCQTLIIRIIISKYMYSVKRSPDLSVLIQLLIYDYYCIITSFQLKANNVIFVPLY